jgi:hypothetical protein
VLSRLNRLYYEERGLRERLARERKYLDHLQQILDKLCFANNAYQGRAIQSQGELDTHVKMDTKNTQLCLAFWSILVF